MLNIKYIIKVNFTVHIYRNKLICAHYVILKISIEINLYYTYGRIEIAFKQFKNIFQNNM
jgi:hypothetical protein